MIKAIIIDDDVEMLQGLSHFIDWSEYGYTISGLSKNGAEGLNLAREVRPDVIITDITMPSMNGLELIHAAKEINPEIKSIIISCHEDFHYAKEAIRLGADEYILKHTLTKDDFIVVLNRVREKILRERTMNDELSGARQSLNKNREIIHEKFFRDILEGSLTEKKAREAAGRLKLVLPPGRFQTAALFIDDVEQTIADSPIKEAGLLKSSILNIISDTVAGTDTLNCFAHDKHAFILIYWEHHNTTAHSLKLQKLTERIQANINTYLDVKVSACIGGLFTGLADLSPALDEMNRLRDYYFYTGTGSLILPAVRAARDSDDLYKRYGVEFCNRLNLPGHDSLLAYMAWIYEDLAAGNCAPASVRSLFRRFLADVEVLLNKRRTTFEYASIDGDTFATCQRQMHAALIRGLNLLHDRNRASSRPEINQVLDYIDLHLKEAISCESMAELVNLNFSYFSRLFKNEMGLSFSDYLLSKRMETATGLLLNTSYSAEEIAELIGITSISYFYRAYKKITGKTPGDVRANK